MSINLRPFIYLRVEDILAGIEQFLSGNAFYYWYWSLVSDSYPRVKGTLAGYKDLLSGNAYSYCYWTAIPDYYPRLEDNFMI